MITHYQSQFADAPDAAEEFARGNLEGDVQFPRAPVHDQAVVHWMEYSHPRLSPTHDTVGRALASFFPREGGWVYLTQDTISRAAALSRPTVCAKLKDLERVGRIERQDMPTFEGKRGDIYRLRGGSTDWDPVDLGLPERTTPGEFEKDMEILAQRRRISELEELVREMAAQVPDGTSLPDSAITILQGESAPLPPSGFPKRDDAGERMRTISDNDKALLSKSLNSGLDATAHQRGDYVTESQLIAIAIQTERTGLSHDEIKARWEEFNRDSDAPALLEPGHLTKSRAFRLVRWLNAQPDAALEGADVPAPQAQGGCTCPVLSERASDPDDLTATEIWSEVLVALERQLPRPTFETWLQSTDGIGYDEDKFLVQVPTAFAIEWLERRMYHSIERTLQELLGYPLAVQFRALGECPVHETL